MARPVPPEAASSSDEEDIGDADLDNAAGLTGLTSELHSGGGSGGDGNAVDSSDDAALDSFSQQSSSDEGSDGGTDEASDQGPPEGFRSDVGNKSGNPASSDSEGEPLQQRPAADSGASKAALQDASSMPSFSSSDDEGDQAEAAGGGVSVSQVANAQTRTSDGGSGENASADADKEPAGPFKSKDKGAAIAKAFAKVTHGRTEDRKAGAGILSGSKSVLKRQREEAAEEAIERKAKMLRQEMRKRGHAKVPRRGEEPSHDVTEKLLLRTARKGVVRLFNAVSKAQKQVVEQQAVGGRTKGQQLTKADFLAELRGKSKASSDSKAPRGAKSATAVGVSPSEQAAASDVPAWAPLRDDDLAALSRGMKMKDWDKTEEQSGLIEETREDEAESDAD